jgi:hypothetical protein
MGTQEAQEKIERGTSTQTSSFNCPNDPWLTSSVTCVKDFMQFSGTAEFTREDINNFEMATAPLSAIPLIQIDRDTLRGQLSNAVKRLEPEPVEVAVPLPDARVIDAAMCRACGVITDAPVGNPAADPAPAPKPAPLPVLQKGADGGVVEALQYLLRHAGATDIVIDGDFGDQTDEAVRDFQKKQYLAQDGKVGAQTWAKLWVTVKKDASQRDVVRAAQALLNWQGKDVTIDGDFGDQTDAAVRAFQADKKLAVDGVVGPATWGALVTK